jgi:hypothetical protein
MSFMVTGDSATVARASSVIAAEVHLISHVHPRGALPACASKVAKTRGPAKGDRLPGMAAWAEVGPTLE